MQSEDPFSIYKLLNANNKAPNLGHFKKSEVPRSGGLILQLIDELVKVGQTIDGILCVWDPKLFKKMNATVLDYFIMVRGDWVSNDKKLLIISEGEVVIMGDFNEVRNKSERFRTVFNRQGADAFNLFIANAGLSEVPLDYWKEAPVSDSNALVKMMKKLKYLKEKIRMWNKLNKEKLYNRKRSLKVELAECDSKIDKGEGEFNVVNRRSGVVRLLQEVEKRSQLNIRGIMVDGTWIDSPSLVKSEFLSHFKNRFDRPHGNRIHIDMNFLNKLNYDQIADLECEVSKEGIKRAVWDCGIDKSPGPDGFKFGFYRRYWNIIERDVVDAVTFFFHQGYFPKGGNSSFVTLIPKTPNANMVKDYRPISLTGSIYKIIAKILVNCLVVVLGDLVNEIQYAFMADKKILDGPFILNELVQWCKKKKKKSLVFKVNFKKAYDSVRWDYLDDILRKFGFGEKWCLKQGDPLSPFLFILVMESLHVSFQRVVDGGLFKGIELAPSLNLSHIFYVDDAIFMGQWSESNIDTIVHVLECFHRASGLRINMTKSKLLGISVEDDKVEQAAVKIDCTTLKTPFSYLGSKVGSLMSRIQSWNETIEGMVARLSKGKLKTLSIGGRLTLLKSVLGSMPIYHMTIFKVPMKVLHRMESIRSKIFNGVDSSSKKSVWVKWKTTLTSKDKGGLGISSLFALNRALMFKWVWRFNTQISSLWAKVIKAMHGDDGKIGLDFSFRRAPRGGAEQSQFELLKEKVEGCTLVDMKDRWVSSKTRWIKEVLIKVNVHAWKVKLDCLPTRLNISRRGLDFSFRRAPRGGAEQSQFELLKEKVEGCTLVDMKDRWVSSKTRWIKEVLIKVNVHAWKVKLDCLPTRLNISRRGMDIDSILCPMCGKAVEFF
ncbi:RNA-directed DNA polymerase, eukaryota, reverse transcriptase zinc-binding domain protein [Tanacetum coccineum]